MRKLGSAWTYILEKMAAGAGVTPTDLGDEEALAALNIDKKMDGKNVALDPYADQPHIGAALRIVNRIDAAKGKPPKATVPV